MLHESELIPASRDDRNGRGITESLQDKLDILAGKSGLSSFERGFVAKLRGGYVPSQNDLAVLEIIWRRHRFMPTRRSLCG